jgi:hypothetical protein
VVDTSTIKALLTEPALARFDLDSFRFCRTPDCDVVYFGADTVFWTRDVRVPVWQKRSEGGRQICYCFGENETAIADEIRRHGASRAVERVREHIAAKRCACDVRNPRGACCLGDVLAAVKRARLSIEPEDASTATSHR